MNRITSPSATLPKRPIILAIALPKTALILAVCCCAHAAEPQFHQTLHDKIPLFATASDSPLPTLESSTTDECVIVPPGATVEVTRCETALDILNRGTLILRDGFHLRCRVLQQADDGARIEIRGSGTLEIRDLPFATFDGLQYGNGLVVSAGDLVIDGTDYRTTWCHLSGEIRAGDTSISLADVPRGWQVGDRLVLPDTRQPKNADLLSEQTEVVTIGQIEWPAIHLAAPVQNDHNGYRDGSGALVLLPDVGNLTQPVIIKSESPNGTRGHVFVTAGVHQSVSGVSVAEMGRTTTAPLGVGNQIGRYAWHHHHLLGRIDPSLTEQFLLEHVAIEGSPKWGIAVHGSHFGVVNDCFAYDCAGSGIVTEDPWVYGNKITNNMVVAKRPGSGLRITTDHGGRAGRNQPSGDHWHDRGGLGLESAMNEITGNRLYCCKESIGMAGFGTSQLYRPLHRGVCPSCNPANREILASHMGYVSGQPGRYPFVFDTSGNLAWAGWRGIELWSADTHLDYEHGFDGLALVHCRNSTDLQDQQETVIRGWRILGDYSSQLPKDNGTNATYALDFKPAYRFGITAIDCEFKGHGAAYRLVNDAHYTRFQNCTFDCPVINFLPSGRAVNVAGGWEGTWGDCTFVGDPVFADGQYPKFDLSLWLTPNSGNRALLPIRYFVRPWKDGKDYQVFHYEQHPDWQMQFPYADHPYDPTKRYGDLPKGVTSQRQLIDLNPPQPIFGDAVPVEAERWGHFWAAPLDCCEIVPRLRAKILELEQGN